MNVSSGGGQLADGADGWAPAYCISKTALNGVTIQLAAALPKFAVNSVCPGWVRTDIGGENAIRSVAEWSDWGERHGRLSREGSGRGLREAAEIQGASGVVWLAADAPQKETSKFWRDRKVILW